MGDKLKRALGVIITTLLLVAMCSVVVCGALYFAMWFTGLIFC